ncbi:sigma-54-dependent Fis family transcriptional regulator [Cytobacillus oceanisediminis]|uniref:Sigma-54 interacting transcriptional regulator n=1 Tax=Cytobacillus oceanisediminis TaxID=665099 RepID=A0A562K5H6_9BACI|nr:sigma-54-dependent Fis family transcriptional regulator [Cytobacillus oceanisediminis]TWH90682.1 sigma-54 interacting transcriptional regulator [Cytobacillus oceanisediminis]
MKIKTLFIAPYPAMIPLIEECRGKEDDLDIKIERGNLGHALPYVKNAEANGTEIIISRGGTAKLIEQETNIPVIDVQVSGYDMLRVLTLANDFPGKKAIVGFSNITLGAKTITDILEIGIEVFTVAKEEEVEGLVFELKSKGFELIMGDVVTVEAASKFGLEGILIQSGREAIYDAFYKAKSVYHSFRKKQMENELLKEILKANAENILVTDSKGEKVFEQWNTFTLPPVQPSQLGTLVHRMESPNSVVTMNGKKGEVLKIRVSTLKIGEESFTQFVISELESEKQPSSNVKIEAVPQLPMIIQESEAMKECLGAISAANNRNFWILIGSAGTGKSLIARYIHYLRYQGRGLFASIHAEENMKMPDGFDEDIRTIFIYGAEEISSKKRSGLVKHCKQWTQAGKEVILSLQGETKGFHSAIFDDEANRVYIPSLTERREDIRPMTAYFIASFHQKLGTSAIKIKEEAIELLEQYNWPGNAAELKTFLYDVVTAEKGYTIWKETVAKHLKRKQPRPSQIDEGLLTGTLDQIEKRIIEAVMEEEDQNQTKVSKRLGINRSTLWRKLKQ